MPNPIGTGPGVKKIAKDTGAGKRVGVTIAPSGPATPGADGGVKNRAGSGGTSNYPQGASSRASKSNVTAGDGGVKRVPHSGSGAPAAAAPPASARRLSDAATAPQTPAVAGSTVPPSSTSAPAKADRAGLLFPNDS